MALLLTWSGYALHPTATRCETLNRWRSTQTKGPPFHLSPPRRQLLLAIIRSHCQSRDWQLHALHIRDTHIHLVIDAAEDSGRILGELKAACTRALRAAGLADPGQRIWADYRNVRNLRNQKALSEAIAYVLHGQGPPMETWPPVHAHSR